MLFVDSARRADPPNAVEFVARCREREIGARKVQRRANARFRRREPRHHQIERIARPFAVGQQAVEFGVGAKRRRFERCVRFLEQRGEDLAPEFEFVERRKFDGFWRVEQRDRGAGIVVVAKAENRREPADRAIGLPLQQQQPQLRPVLQRRVDKFAEPIADLFGAAGGIIDDDEDGLVPAPLLNAVLAAKAVKLLRAGETGEPSALRSSARKLQREPRLAASARADQNANGNWRGSSSQRRRSPISRSRPMSGTTSAR